MKVAGLDAEVILMTLLGAAMGDKKLSDKDAAQLLLKLYEENVDNFGPLIRAFPKVAKRASKDLAPFCAGLLALASGVMEDAGIRAASEKFNKARAENRMKFIDVYMTVGFTRQEAMAILLQDIAKAPSTSSLKTSTFTNRKDN